MRGKIVLLFFICITSLLFSISAWADFSDLKSTSWAYHPVKQLVGKNVLTGYPDGTFRPDAFVSRYEFAKIMTLAINLSNATNVEETFLDVKQASWAYPYVEASKFYLSGYNISGDSYFMGNEEAVREDMAVALVKALSIEVGNDDTEALKTIFKDHQEIASNLKKYVLAAYKNGLISGYPDGTFRPQGKITRAETASLLIKVMGSEAIKKVSYDEFGKIKHTVNVTSTYPERDQKDVLSGKQVIKVWFSNVLGRPLHGEYWGARVMNKNGEIIANKINFADENLITIDADLLAEETYTVTLKGLVDRYQNRIEENSFTFNTKENDKSGVGSTVPASGVTIQTVKEIRVIYLKDVNLTLDQFYIEDEMGVSKKHLFSECVMESERVAVFKMAEGALTGGKYTITLLGVREIGKEVLPTYQFSFTVTQEKASFNFLGSVPSNGSRIDVSGTNLLLSFDKEITKENVKVTITPNRDGKATYDVGMDKLEPRKLMITLNHLEENTDYHILIEGIWDADKTSALRVNLYHMTKTTTKFLSISPKDNSSILASDSYATLYFSDKVDISKAKATIDPNHNGETKLELKYSEGALPKETLLLYFKNLEANKKYDILIDGLRTTSGALMVPIQLVYTTIETSKVSIIKTNVSQGQKNVKRNQVFSIEFSQGGIDSKYVAGRSLRLEMWRDGKYEYSYEHLFKNEKGDQVFIYFDKPLKAQSNYTIKVKDILDQQGNQIHDVYELNFTTGDVLEENKEKLVLGDYSEAAKKGEVYIVDQNHTKILKIEIDEAAKKILDKLFKADGTYNTDLVTIHVGTTGSGLGKQELRIYNLNGWSALFDGTCSDEDFEKYMEQKAR